MNRLKGKILLLFAVCLLLAAPAGAREPEQVVTIGTRFTVTESESTVPVEVINPEELRSSGASELKTVLENILPSFILNQSVVTDATDAYATAQMRGLGPDQILVLVNGKRRHQYPVPSIVSPVGSGAAGTDLSAIPVGAVERIEILGPGAAAQYGSDAIAGVINVVLKNDYDGVRSQVEVGQTYEGDGERVTTSLNMGFGSEDSFLNLTLEYRERGETNRAGPFNLGGPDNIVTYTNSVQSSQTPNSQYAQRGFYDTENEAYQTTNDENVNSWIATDSNGNRAVRTTTGFTNPETGFDQSGPHDYTYNFPLDDRTFQDEVYFRGTPQGVVRQRLGQIDAEDYSLWLNGRKEIAAGAFYAFGGYNKRETDSSGFFRHLTDFSGRTVPEIYGAGHLPNIVLKPEDLGITAGFEFDAAGIDWDVSYSFGQSKIEHRERNTVNISYYYEPLPQEMQAVTGAGLGCDAELGSTEYRDNCELYRESPTDFDTGTLTLVQNNINIDATTAFHYEGITPAPVNFAFGGEWRREQYEIEAGDPSSYQYGRNNDGTVSIGNYFCTIDDPVNPNEVHPSCAAAAPGSQGFPGYHARDEIKDSRDLVSAYAQAETDLNEFVHSELAGRYEWYSDFGSTINGKFSTRVDLLSGLLSLRGNVATGFRAPGVQQTFFQHITTTVVNQQLQDVLTALPGGPIAETLGFKDLEEETSLHFGIGFALRPAPNLNITLDAYRINIDDRIIYSNGLELDPSVPAESALIDTIRTINDGIEARTFQFFTNGVDTRTYGLDFAARYNFAFMDATLVNLGAMIHLNNTKVTDKKSVSSLFSPDQLISVHQELALEKGAPRVRGTLSSVAEKGRFGLTLRANYYGSIEASYWADQFGECRPDCVQKFDAMVTFDAEVRADLHEGVTLAVGAQNLFDSYPEKLDSVNASLIGRGFVYGWESSRVYPADGGFYYMRLTTSL